MTDVAYLCDRLQCEKCSYPVCKHTLKIEHAVNFENIGTEEHPCYFEKVEEKNDDR